MPIHKFRPSLSEAPSRRGWLTVRCHPTQSGPETDDSPSDSLGQLAGRSGVAIQRSKVG
jgi:hypothetical protein